ncbi:replicative DNA helicase, partial [bacterium]|nr:replicative DNA helicase [bacterium]
MMDYGKIPPQARDMEEVLLGALLIDPDSVDGVLSLLPDDAFYIEAHQIIYRSIKK